jgi:phage terminase large subunit
MSKKVSAGRKLSGFEKEQFELYQSFADMALAEGCHEEQIANFLSAGIILQPKQLQIAAKCRECDLPDGPKRILAGGGRGSAKSHGLLAQIFADDCQRVKGLKALALRKVGRANKEQINDFRKKLLMNLTHNYREQAQEIIFANGSMVILGNFKDEKDIDKYLGLEYDVIYIMESNQLTASKKTNILSCLRTNKQNWRPRCYEDTNPGGIDHVGNKRLFVDPWKEKREKETRYIHSTVDDNKFVDSGYKKFLETLVGWQREAWLNGSWEFMAGAFFSNFHQDVHVYPNEQTQFNPRSIIRWFAGLDYGFSHPSVFTLMCEDESGNIFVPAIYSASNTLIEEHAANIRDLLSRFNLDPGELEFIAAGKDCFRVDKDGSTVATEYLERGINLTPVHIDRINAWSQVAEVFGSIEHQIKPRCFIHRDCTELIEQIQSAQSDPKKPNDVLKMNADAETGEGGDDALESFRNGIVMAYSSMLTFAKAVQMGSFKSLSSSEESPVIDVESIIEESERSDLEQRGIFTP